MFVQCRSLPAEIGQPPGRLAPIIYYHNILPQYTILYNTYTNNTANLITPYIICYLYKP